MTPNTYNGYKTIAKTRMKGCREPRKWVSQAWLLVFPGMDNQACCMQVNGLVRKRVTLPAWEKLNAADGGLTGLVVFL